MPYRNQLSLAAEIFGEEENLSPVVIPTLSKDMDEQLKLAHKVLDVVDRANKKICVTLLRTSQRVLLLESECLQRRRRTKFSANVFVNYKAEKLIYKLDVLNSVCDKFIAKNPFETSYKNYLHYFALYHFSSFYGSR